MTQDYKVSVSMNQAAVIKTGLVLKQGDFGFNLKITVLDFDVTGTTPQIVFRKPMGAVESTDVTASGNVYTYVMKGTELDTPGKVICDLKLKNSTTQRISTASFMFEVVADTMDGLNQQASSYSDTLEKMLNEFKNISPGRNSVNLFNKTNVVAGKILAGNIGSEASEIDNSNFAYYIFDIPELGNYIVSGTSYKYFLLDANNIVLSEGGNDSQSVSNVVISVENANAKKIAINFRPATFSIDTYMICAGNTMPEEYEPYGIYEFNESAKKSIEEIIIFETEDSFTNIENQIANTSERVNNCEVNIPGKVSANLFNKENVVAGKILAGNIGSEASEIDNSNFAYYIFDIPELGNYIVSGTSYKYFLLDANNIVLSEGGNDSQSVSNVVISVENANAKKIAINFRPATFSIDTYMICAGNTMPEEYEPYGIYEFNESAKKGIISAIKDEGNIYYINRGVQSDVDYADPIACFNAIKNVSGNKKVYIYPGEYDIYSLMGGDDYFENIDPQTQSTYDVQPWLNDIEIIGLGKVVFKFYMNNDLPSTTRWLFSPLNVRGNAKVKNLEILASNARYCIHDESSNNYPNTDRVFENLKCKMISGGGQALGSGYSEYSSVTIKNSYFYSNTNAAFSCHSKGDATLKFENSIFETNEATYPAIRISQENNRYNYACINNCCCIAAQYHLRLSGEYEYTAPRIDKTRVDIINSNIENVQLENAPYPYTDIEESVTKYNTITGTKTILVQPD